MMEFSFLITNLKRLVPEITRVESDITKEFCPNPPGINSLCSAIGWCIAENFASNEDSEAVFALIESGMETGDEELKTAIATGLLEAIISQCDYHPGKWDRIAPYLGPLSDAYAKAWIKFTETGEM